MRLQRPFRAHQPKPRLRSQYRRRAVALAALLLFTQLIPAFGVAATAVLHAGFHLSDALLARQEQFIRDRIGEVLAGESAMVHSHGPGTAPHTHPVPVHEIAAALEAVDRDSPGDPRAPRFVDVRIDKHLPPVRPVSLFLVIEEHPEFVVSGIGDGAIPAPPASPPPEA